MVQAATCERGDGSFAGDGASGARAFEHPPDVGTKKSPCLLLYRRLVISLPLLLRLCPVQEVKMNKRNQDANKRLQATVGTQG